MPAQLVKRMRCLSLTTEISLLIAQVEKLVTTMTIPSQKIVLEVGRG